MVVWILEAKIGFVFCSRKQEVHPNCSCTFGKFVVTFFELWVFFFFGFLRQLCFALETITPLNRSE